MCTSMQLQLQKIYNLIGPETWTQNLFFTLTLAVFCNNLSSVLPATTSYGWAQWSRFTPCDESCYKSRERYCYHPGTNKQFCGGNVNVYGSEKEKVKCSSSECPGTSLDHVCYDVFWFELEMDSGFCFSC